MADLLFADMKGRLYEDRGQKAVGRTGTSIWELEDSDFIPIPEGADLVLLPQRLPVSVNAVNGDLEILESFNDIKGTPVAVAATLPVGYTRTFLPGYERMEGAEPLPLFGYTAVGSIDGELVVAAIRTDDPEPWNPMAYNNDVIRRKVDALLTECPNNRILKQLAECSLKYHCITAQNIFRRFGEGGIPVSPGCNAACRGCISFQESECCPSPQSRIDFVPTIEEILEIAVPHLESAPGAIISFGQGCEGDPLTQGLLLAEAISAIRRETSKGTININTNAGGTEALKAILDAGLDTIRVSIFSPIEDEYVKYHQPRSYTFSNVLDSLKLCREKGVQISLNLLTFPGYTDDRFRVSRLSDLIGTTGVIMVQLRNLNLDPDILFDELGLRESDEPIGIRNMISELTSGIPGLRIGNYSKPGVSGE